jgi:superfamily I DNA/RNA helicase
MQEVRDALVAISEGFGSGLGGSAPTGRAPRTSFTYSSRPTTEGGQVGSSGTVASCVSAVKPLTESPSPPVIRSTAAMGISASFHFKTPVEDTRLTHAQTEPERHPHPQSGAPALTRPPPLIPTAAATTATSSPPATAPSSSLSMLRMDESQIRAATYPVDTPLLLQAGAGSGKTQTMAARIVFLLESGVPARCILGICFTRQAAETLRGRVRATLPPPLARQAHDLKLKTFHAFGLECLRRFGNLPADTHVLDARQQHQLARKVVETYAQREKSSEAAADLVDYVNHVKTMKVPPIAQSDPGVQDAYLFPHYQRMLHEEHNAVDFGDLQQMFYDLLRPVSSEPSFANEDGAQALMESGKGGSGALDESSQKQQQQQQQGRRYAPSPVCAALRAEYTHFVVDEFQDFNEIQVELLALLAGDECRVTCVGDPNQCIYTWRGAMPNVFGVWKRRFPRSAVLSLALNYRSDGPIVDAANKVVKARQQAHHHREERAVTLVQCATEDDELQAVPLVLEHVLRRRDPQLGYGDIAILCRSRRRVQLYCDVLRSQRIPVRQLKAISVDRLSTMRSLLALLRLCLSPHSPEGDANVRAVLSTAPLHRLPVGAAKKFFLSLDSVCQARRSAEAAQIHAWRHTMDDGSPLSGVDDASRMLSNNNGRFSGVDVTRRHIREPAVAPALGVHPETYSFFAVLQELVYHNFSREAFPKLEVSKKSQKTIRHVVQLILHVREMLAQPSCDVEQVLRYVLREGGYESDSACAVATRTTPTGPSPHRSGAEAGKRQRSDADGSAEDHDGAHAAGPHIKRVGTLLMEQCASQHNEQQQQQQQPGQYPNDWRRRSTAPTASRRAGGTATFDDGGGLYGEDVMSPEEEAVVWQEQRMNLPELVLHTYRGVHEALQREAAQQMEARAAQDGADPVVGVVDESGAVPLPISSASQSCSNPPSRSNSSTRWLVHPRRPNSGADDSVSVLSNGTCAGTPTLMQSLCPPAVVLRRVLDEFVSLVSSDDYGPMREPEKTSSNASEGSSTAVAVTPQWIGQVTVGTVHRAKGMEWPAVLLPGCWVGEYPVRPREEEKRVFYVGMSRAMKHLICFTAAQKEGASGDVNAAAAACPGVAASSSAGTALEETPYLAAVGDQLERVAFADLKAAYLKEHGYI